jgi:hypothetical protein
VAKSTNKGTTWQLLSFDTIGTRSILAIAFDPIAPGFWYSGPGNPPGNVLRSTDWGIHWSMMDPPITGLNGAVVALAFSADGTTLCAGAQNVTNYAEGSGVYRYRSVVGVQRTWEIPRSVRLLQNFPNPFNPATEIGFQIADYGLVTLRVYDLLGREVATLVNEVKQPGVHVVQWNASGVTSGVYVYRLSMAPLAPRDLVPSSGRDGQAGNKTLSRKAVVLK